MGSVNTMESKDELKLEKNTNQFDLIQQHIKGDASLDRAFVRYTRSNNSCRVVSSEPS